MPRVWTVGYLGRDLPEFIQDLQAAGVQTVIDVRALALSRKPGFSKAGLKEALTAAGMAYEHRPRLGTPKLMRDAYRADGDFLAFSQAYEQYLGTVGEAVAGLAATALDERVALMCAEADPATCHRSVLAASLAPLGFEIVHL